MEAEIILRLRRNLSSSYDTENKSTLMAAGMARELLEDIIYCAHRERDLGNAARQPAVSADPRALRFSGGGNFRRNNGDGPDGSAGGRQGGFSSNN